MKLGRRRPAPGRKLLKLRDYLKSEAPLPAPPASVDYSAPAAAVLSQVFMNDQLGDCVIAGAYHVVGVETGNAGDLFTATQDQILADYEAIGGYVPGDPSTDQGCDEGTALDYWCKTGFADGTKLAGYLALDARNQTEVMQAMDLFENLYFGLELPDAWVSPFPSSPGFVWDVGTPNPDNGHCVMGVGYNEKGVQIDSWGLIGTITWAAIAALAVESAGGQLYVLLTPDQVSSSQATAPNGLDWAALQADFAALGGTPAAPPSCP